MDNIFQKNISALVQKNQALALRLAAYIPAEIPKVVTENGAYNIVYRSRHVHNVFNPIGEAKEIFSMAENVPIAIHLVYGLGLGYLFQVACANSSGTVILYEPDLNILRLSFMLVDFSADILRKNVFISDNYEDISDYIYKKSGTTNVPQLLSLPSQREFDPEAFDGLVEKLRETVGSYGLDLRYTKEKMYENLTMMIRNFPDLMKEIPLAHYKDIYKGKTGVVVSAGPTLDRNIETLKKYRDRYVLFTVGTALKTLIANGIRPDFLCIIETYDSSKQVEGLDLSEVNFVTEPYSNPATRRFKYKRIYSHISANMPVNHLWAEISGEDIEEYWSKGTVSYTALNCARLLGCSKIVLVGQDLAYIGGQCYSKDSAYKDLQCTYDEETNKWKITAKDFDKFAEAISSSADKDARYAAANRRLSTLNNSLYYVKGVDGSMLPTESVYAAFISPLSQYAEHFNDREYVNTSMVGAQIDGFKNIPLEEALSDSERVENIELTGGDEPRADIILDNIRSKLTELKDGLRIIDDGRVCLRGLNNELTRSKAATVDVLQLLKKLSLNYLSLSEDFTERSKMFEYITTADKIDLDYEMKMVQSFTPESVRRIADKIAAYYDNAVNRISELEGLIMEVLGENINTKG